mmetsp:Transcript_15428/g.26336  ORF Transcript_15428/g.26336 Transcript_15428/m.26336 type:complete len:126 (+) Transcript_15428:20-397(+)
MAEIFFLLPQHSLGAHPFFYCRWRHRNLFVVLKLPATKGLPYNTLTCYNLITSCNFIFELTHALHNFVTYNICKGKATYNTNKDYSPTSFHRHQLDPLERIAKLVVIVDILDPTAVVSPTASSLG